MTFYSVLLLCALFTSNILANTARVGEEVVNRAADSNNLFEWHERALRGDENALNNPLYKQFVQLGLNNSESMEAWICHPKCYTHYAATGKVISAKDIDNFVTNQQYLQVIKQIISSLIRTGNLDPAHAANKFMEYAKELVLYNSLLAKISVRMFPNTGVSHRKLSMQFMQNPRYNFEPLAPKLVSEEKLH